MWLKHYFTYFYVICNKSHCFVNFSVVTSRQISLFSSRSTMVRILNVAEKNDASKSISEIMANGRYRRRDGFSVYNKIYEFDYNVFNQQCVMVMTSVSGHLLNLEFVGSYKKWQACNPLALFEAPVALGCPEDYQGIKRTLEREVRNCSHLIIWTDCDREGENIGFEIIDVCKAVKSNIKVHRAKFSEITRPAITRAISNLIQPDKHLNDAVNVRRELDLRIGAAFTRFQTLRLQKVFPEILTNQLISYGSCQFPTLGFVVDRYKQVQAFIPEPFWKLKVTHKKEDTITEFSWKRGRLFDHTACLVLYQVCLEEPTAEVVDIRSKPKSKWRPQPLDTVELEKMASRKLHINAKEALNIAEKLYTKGYISYPRTETTIFPKELDLAPLVQMQCGDPQWGTFAAQVLTNGPNPRQGSKTDNAHPPIHPTKYADNLQGNEKKVYEFVVRHFLACVSKDAEGRETTIEITVNDERFAVNGLMIIARNYLDVYPYEKWNAKVIGEYNLGERFQPTSIEMLESETNAPELLTEADLIALMEKHGIGTDATHAEHIETIKSRLYVGLNQNTRFVPGELGMGLVEGYDLMGFHMSKPHLRAELEADLKRICEGTKDPQVVLRTQISKYKEYFIEAVRQANKIDEALSSYFQATPGEFTEDNYNETLPTIMKCPKCGTGDIIIKTKREGNGFYLSCLAYPNCNAVIWLPDCVESVAVSNETCNLCQPGPIMKLDLKVKRGALRPYFGDELRVCLGGCDQQLMDVLNVRPLLSQQNSSISISRGSNNGSVITGHSADTGYSSFQQQNQNSRVLSESTPIARVNTNSRNSSNNSSRNQPNNSNQSFSKRSTIPNGNGAKTSHWMSDGFNTQNKAKIPTSLNNSFAQNSIRLTNGSDGNEVVCNCGKPALYLTVKKEGPNKGRHFYVCNEPQNSKCKFFLWDDGDASNENSSRPSYTTMTTNTSVNNFSRSRSLPEDSKEICHCSTKAKMLTVNKENENKGRKFYVCGNRENPCKYFAWADDGAGSSNTTSNVTMSSADNSRSKQSNRRRIQSDSGPVAKRKCGLCNEPGHDKRNCPLNS